MTTIASYNVAAGDEVLHEDHNTTVADLVVNAGDTVVSTGSANAYVLTMTSLISAYTTYMVVKFKASFANTGACTININGLGAKSIKKYNGEALASGDIQSGQMVELQYDGTNFQMLSPIYNVPRATHTHTNNFYIGNSSRSTSDSSGTQVITVGFAPKMIKIRAVEYATGLEVLGRSDGHATSISNSYCIYTLQDTTTSTESSDEDASNIIRIYDDISSPNGWTATVSAIDSTSFTLNWTKVSGGINLLFIYEVWGNTN